jgi:hypothetical protein
MLVGSIKEVKFLRITLIALCIPELLQVSSARSAQISHRRFGGGWVVRTEEGGASEIFAQPMVVDQALLTQGDAEHPLRHHRGPADPRMQPAMASSIARMAELVASDARGKLAVASYIC